MLVLLAAMSFLMSFAILGPAFFGSFLLEPKKVPQGCGSQSFPPDRYRHKKARRACAMRALRTSSDDSGNHRWRILVGWRELNLLFITLIMYHINDFIFSLWA